MTQGHVTVLKDGKVVMKIISGNDGMNAKNVAKKIKKLRRVPRLKEAYNLASRLGFGSPDRLVVMGEKRSWKNNDVIGRLHRRYRRTFHQPRFNPRWKYGTADHIVIVRL